MNSKGQTLMEVIVAVAVGILVVSALTFATIFSLRNANFAKNQAQATKLAQEGIERIRSLRDRDKDGTVDYTRADLSHTSKFSDLWSISFSCPSNCYFVFISEILTGATSASFESIPSNFQRQFKIEDDSDGSVQKKVTSTVRWTDFSGTHESRLTTILRKL